MYEHPYLAYAVTESQQAEIQQAADRRRFLIEHADQIVPRAAGPLRRLRQRMLRVARSARGTSTGRVSSGSRTPDAAVHNPIDRPSAAGCEPAPAR